MATSSLRETALIRFTVAQSGIQAFDTAEIYAGNGDCEREMGRVIKELGWNRCVDSLGSN